MNVSAGEIESACPPTPETRFCDYPTVGIAVDLSVSPERQGPGPSQSLVLTARMHALSPVEATFSTGTRTPKANMHDRSIPGPSSWVDVHCSWLPFGSVWLAGGGSFQPWPAMPWARLVVAMQQAPWINRLTAALPTALGMDESGRMMGDLTCIQHTAHPRVSPSSCLPSLYSCMFTSGLVAQLSNRRF